MYSPPTWYFAAAALIATSAFIARYWVLMPQYRMRFLLIPLLPALALLGGAAVKHKPEAWPLLMFIDVMLVLTALTIPYGQVLRQAAIERVAGRPVPQVPAWVAFPMVGLGLALIIGEAILFR
jgi:hypothetical protein